MFSHTQLLLRVITQSTKLSFVFIKVISNSFRFSQGVPMEEEEEGNKLQVSLVLYPQKVIKEIRYA